ncbi:MAG: carbon monoxide dehydrogenase subunit G [Chloroflexi bacterium]|nr:carbon monoxide dehydrogenase subunit G [Chloroflexota bacterium]
MELAGTYSFVAPRETVWQAIMDPEVLAKCLPGCERLEKVSETEYLGTLNVRVGPVQGRFSGKVELSDKVEPENFHMDINGKGAAGFVKGGGDAHLEEVDGKTVLTYSGEAQVGGRIASVGQRLLETSAKSIVRQGLESLDRIIAAQAQPEAADDPIPEIAPPTQTEVAMGVARDLYDEFVPEEQRSALIAVVAALGAMVVVLLLLKLLRSDD